MSEKDSMELLEQVLTDEDEVTMEDETTVPSLVNTRYHGSASLPGEMFPHVSATQGDFRSEPIISSHQAPWFVPDYLNHSDPTGAASPISHNQDEACPEDLVMRDYAHHLFMSHNMEHISSWNIDSSLQMDFEDIGVSSWKTPPKSGSFFHQSFMELQETLLTDELGTPGPLLSDGGPLPILHRSLPSLNQYPFRNAQSVESTGATESQIAAGKPRSLHSNDGRIYGSSKGSVQIEPSIKQQSSVSSGITDSHTQDVIAMNYQEQAEWMYLVRQQTLRSGTSGSFHNSHFDGVALSLHSDDLPHQDNPARRNESLSLPDRTSSVPSYIRGSFRPTSTSLPLFLYQNNGPALLYCQNQQDAFALREVSLQSTRQLLLGQGSIPQSEADTNLQYGNPMLQYGIPATQLSETEMQLVIATQREDGRQIVHATQFEAGRHFNLTATQREAGRQLVPATQHEAGRRLVPATHREAGRQLVPATQHEAGRQLVPATHREAGRQLVPATQRKAGRQLVPATQREAQRQLVTATQREAGGQLVPAVQRESGRQLVPIAQFEAERQYILETALRQQQHEQRLYDLDMRLERRSEILAKKACQQEEEKLKYEQKAKKDEEEKNKLAQELKNKEEDLKKEKEEKIRMTEKCRKEEEERVRMEQKAREEESERLRLQEENQEIAEERDKERLAREQAERENEEMRMQMEKLMKMIKMKNSEM